MQPVIIFILFVFLLISPENSWAEKNYRIVVFGDSLVAGYQLQKDDAFSAKLGQRVRAAGYEQIEIIDATKETTSSASATMETDFIKQKLPDVIIIALGFNDAKRGVLTSAVGYNLNAIITDLKRTNAYIILAGNNGYASRGEQYNTELKGYFYTIANAQSVPLYPSILEGVEGNTSLTMADGLHPNAAGVEKIVEGIFPLVDTGLRWRYDLYQQEVQRAKEAQSLIPAPPAP